ncbi:MAG: response regulator [Candidatus Zixiibacteriota bacterium]|nr:MAG: response regulator [candidate division Zixibacteria bacterium]
MTIISPFAIDTARTSSMRVLIVDDDSSLSDFLRQFLEELKFNVEIASSGEEAISRLNDIDGIDIALIDFRLPGMDGLETIKKISEFSPDTVTMVITGLPTLDSSIRAIRLGASDYILKPFRLDDIAVAIKKAMKEREIKSEIKNLKEKVAAMDKNELPSDNIDLSEKVGGTGKINVSPEINKDPESPPPIDYPC